MPEIRGGAAPHPPPPFPTSRRGGGGKENHFFLFTLNFCVHVSGCSMTCICSVYNGCSMWHVKCQKMSSLSRNSCAKAFDNWSRG